eukprot:scaffold59243_cov15-Prasinocladus_malaysianus.AAC.1
MDKDFTLIRTSTLYFRRFLSFCRSSKFPGWTCLDVQEDIPYATTNTVTVLVVIFLSPEEHQAKARHGPPPSIPRMMNDDPLGPVVATVCS